VSGETHKLYHLTPTNSIIWVPRTLSSKSHQLYHSNFTNSSIWIFQSLSSQSHELYHRSPTNSIIWIPRTLSSRVEQLYHQISQALPSKSHELTHLDLHFFFVGIYKGATVRPRRPMNSTIEISRTLSSESHQLYDLDSFLWASIEAPLCVCGGPPTLKFQSHKIYHLSVGGGPRTLCKSYFYYHLKKSYQLYHPNITNCILWISPSLSSNSLPFRGHL